MYYLLWSVVLFSAVLVNGKQVFVSIPSQYATGVFSVSLDCIQKTGVPPDMLQQLIDQRFKDSDQLRKFLYCLGTTSGFVDDTGHFKTDSMVQLVGNHPQKNQFANALNECNKSVGKDKYDTLFKASVCFRAKTPILLKL